MSEKRRDSKGRILRTGESQRKDGRYAYKYVNKLGKERFVYAWKLVSTDKTPTGKREDLSLREKEKQIKEHLEDGFLDINKKFKVVDLLVYYMPLKKHLGYSTQVGYKTLYNLLENSDFGSRKIDDIRLSDCKKWLVELQEAGRKYGTVNTIRGRMKCIFELAVKDDLVRKNPFNFSVSEILMDDRKRKKGLSVEEEEKFLEFIKRHKAFKVYYNAVVILLGTGLRISELCGLCLSAIDIEQRLVRVEGQLLKQGKGEYVYGTTKTISGKRKIPMTETVFKAFIDELDKRKKMVCNVIVNGKNDFLFLTKTGNPRVNQDYGLVFDRIIGSYNRQHIDDLPKITPHVLRHTFCSRLALRGINPKNLQYLMGHSTIDITLDIYTHTSFESVCEEMQRLK